MVIIATASPSRLLERTLSSIGKCELPPSYMSTIIVENGEKGLAESVVERVRQDHGSLRLDYIHVAKANKSHALNVALNQLVGDELVVFSDDDVRVHPQWLRSYAEHSCDTESSMFGGPVLVDYEEKPPLWIRQYLPASCLGISAYDFKKQKADSGFAAFLGCNWAAYAADLLSVGSFNENLGPGTNLPGQETDMQKRLVVAGTQQHIIPDAFVWHYVPRERSSPEWVLNRAYRRGRRNARVDNASARNAGRRARYVASAAVVRTLDATGLPVRIGFNVRYRHALLSGFFGRRLND